VSRRLFTSESVTEGHPDKIADAISDSILDALLAEDPASRVAVETLITTGQVHIAGEVTTSGYADVPTIVRERILEIGYDSSKKGFDGASCGVSVSIGAQSPDIAQGVDTAYEARVEGETDELEQQGAGDQGLMFGFACDETPELMPLPIALAHRLARRLTQVRKDGVVPYLRPTARRRSPSSTSTAAGPPRHRRRLHAARRGHRPRQPAHPRHRRARRRPEIAALGLDVEGYRLLVNPTGKFVIGGRWATPASPAARSSSTPTAATPGTAAAPSPARTRPRSTARRLRHALGRQERRRRRAGHALRVQVAYAIAEPAVGRDSSSTRTAAGGVADEVLRTPVVEVRRPPPAAIIRDLDLLRPISAPSSRTPLRPRGRGTSLGADPTAPSSARQVAGVGPRAPSAGPRGPPRGASARWERHVAACRRGQRSSAASSPLRRAARAAAPAPPRPDDLLSPRFAARHAVGAVALAMTGAARRRDPGGSRR
jgi:S-adenosylmethionine synthetase